MLEIIVERLVFVGENISPYQLEIHLIENETAEQSVFAIVNQSKDLTRGAGESHREFGIGDFNKFSVFATIVGYLLVMESFAQAIGEISVVGLKGVGQGVALGFKQQTSALVFMEGLVNGSCTAVARDEHHFDRRLFGFLVVFRVESVLV